MFDPLDNENHDWSAPSRREAEAEAREFARNVARLAPHGDLPFMVSDFAPRPAWRSDYANDFQ